MMLWAAFVGVLGACATLVFYQAIYVIQNVVVGSSGVIEDVMQASPWYVRLLFPILGGLAGGALLLWASKSKEGSHSDYMEAVSIGDGKLSIRQGLLRSLSSLCSVASGGSIGREGAMIHLASLSASALGRVAQFDTARLRLLVACGAAAGVAAAYGAPVAGALFVAEIVIGTMAIHSLGPLLIAAASANLTMRVLGHHHVTYDVGAISQIGLDGIIPIVILGLFCGVAAPQFLRLLSFSKMLFKRTNLSLPLRLSLGGLLLGGVLVVLPEVSGNGYSVVASLLSNQWPWHAVLFILVGKLIATAFTVGSGAVGGVFTPTIFMGAAFGTLFGQLVIALVPGLPVSPYLFTAVGMGAFLAAGTGAPLMAILMIFEMTLSYQLLVPLMVACVLAYFVSRSIAEIAMYDIILERERNVRLRRSLRETRLQELIQPAVTVVSNATPVKVALQMFLEYPVKYLYVVDEHSNYQGAISHQDIITLLLAQGDIDDKCAGDVLRLDFVKTLGPDMTLDEAQDIFVQFQGERLPVVRTGDQPELLGVVYKSALLEKYSALKRSLDSGAETIYI